MVLESVTYKGMTVLTVRTNGPPHQRVRSRENDDKAAKYTKKQHTETKTLMLPEKKNTFILYTPVGCKVVKGPFVTRIREDPQ